MVSILERIGIKKVKKEANVLISPITGYPIIVDQIHKEFDQAAELLLNEAIEIINKANSKLSNIPQHAENKNKAERLSKLGFNQCDEAVKYKIKSEQISKERQETTKVKAERSAIVEAVEYFRNKYPLYKFITVDQIEQICAKYNLVYAEISRYKGFVPDKNLKEVENFKVKGEDCAYSNEEILSTYSKGRERYFLSAKEVKSEFRFLSDIDNKISRYSNAYYTIKNYSNEDLKRIFGVDFIINPKVTKVFTLNVYEYAYWALDYFNDYDYLLKKCVMPLHIAAPLKDMDTKGLELNGYHLRKKFEFPDPVVFQPVVYKNIKGCLIATKWGDEASDPILYNPVEN